MLWIVATRCTHSEPAPSQIAKTELPPTSTTTSLNIDKFHSSTQSDFAWNGDNERNTQTQLRKTNLGKTLDTLMEILPNLQSQSPPPSLLSPRIQLRLFPKSHPNLPTIRGKTAYLATWRLAQWVIPFFVLGPIDGLTEVKDNVFTDDGEKSRRSLADYASSTASSNGILGFANRFSADHRKGSIIFKIMSMRVINEGSDIDDDLENYQSHLATGDDDHLSATSSTKLLVRWQTSFVPAGASQGGTVLASASAGGDGEEQQIPSIVTGLFTFEFDKSGKILVHSIDDVQEIRTQQTASTPSGLKKLAEAVVGRKAVEDEEEGQVVADEHQSVPRHLA
ncbi:uncharacterized protein V1518DRAFT_375685 [Limtongia smithiae]|uniref:uncharacterized protein n=1 Tax=Limtongia smithiae TaxID=1125753 RepID=UPI0034CED4B1